MFLALGALAVVAIPVWIGISIHGVALWGDLPPQLWHSHEMLFGFAVAAIAGFLLTSVPNWTGTAGFSGMPLVLLATLWLAARVMLIFGPSDYWWMTVVIELAFLPAVAGLLAPPLIRARNRNTVMLAVLCALWLADVSFMLAVWAGNAQLAGRAMQSALNIVLLLITIIGGRIIPLFTANALKRSGQEVAVRVRPLLERSLAVVMIGNVLIDAVAPQEALAILVAGVAAMLHAVRLAGWHSVRTGREPIVWSLHLAYAWLPAGFALKAWSLASAAPVAQFWLHAFAIGVVAMMVLAVTTRVALGHTGRPLRVTPSVAWAYGLLCSSAVARVALPHAGVFDYATSLIVAAALWTSAFLIFLVEYGRILSTPRIDGKPG